MFSIASRTTIIFFGFKILFSNKSKVVVLGKFGLLERKFLSLPHTLSTRNLQKIVPFAHVKYLSWNKSLAPFAQAKGFFFSLYRC